jgi:predicted nuclease with TOPRIM domain
MEQNLDLARLEQFVEKLIESHNQLKNENNEMQVQLKAKQQEISELHEKMKNLQEDRSVMHDRVTGLIGRIDEWEKNFEQDEPEKNTDSGDNLTKKSSPLFNVTSGQSPESAL